jgi:hypothetical protein
MITFFFTCHSRLTRPTKDWIKIITTHLRRHISDLNLIHLTYLITRDLIIQYREWEGLFPLNRAKANVIGSMTIKIYVLGPNSVLDPMECWNNLGFHLVNFVPAARGTSPCHLLIARSWVKLKALNCGFCQNACHSRAARLKGFFVKL